MRKALIALDMAIAIAEGMSIIAACKKQPAWTIAAEEKLERKLKGLFGKVFDDTLDELVKQGRLPATDAARRQIASHINNAKDKYAGILAHGAEEAALYGREEILQTLPGRAKFDEFAAHTKQLLMEYVFVASDRTIERMVGDVMGNLAKSYEAGLGIREAADSLQHQFQGMKDWELRRIARTEINSFQNAGAYLTEKELGIEYHQWWTAEDERVRETEDANHVEMHGQIVKLGERFSNGLEYPGDRSGPLEEFINCRCRAVPYFIPEGMRPPINKDYFYPEDLVDIQDPDAAYDITDDMFAEDLKAKMDAVEGKDKHIAWHRIIQEDIEAGVQQHLANGGSIEGLLPRYDVSKAPKFVTGTHLKKLSNLTSVDARAQGELNSAAGWLAQRVHPDVLRKAAGVKKIHYDAGVRAYYNRKDKFIMWSGDSKTFVHEYGHHLHYYGSDKQKRVTKAFFNKRRKGESLTTIYQGTNEVGYKSTFIEHYVGRVYPWEKAASPFGTEVISMGLQYMQQNPSDFYAMDPSHFRLIYALMRGLL